MITQYFTFGQAHRHDFGSYICDKDIVLRIIGESKDQCRDYMFAKFGQKWSMQYDECPDLSFFPRGVMTTTLFNLKGGDNK